MMTRQWIGCHYLLLILSLIVQVHGCTSKTYFHLLRIITGLDRVWRCCRRLNASSSSSPRRQRRRCGRREAYPRMDDRCPWAFFVTTVPPISQPIDRRPPSLLGLGLEWTKKGTPSKIRSTMIRSGGLVSWPVFSRNATFASDLRRGVQHYYKCMSKCTTAAQGHTSGCLVLCVCGHGSCSIALCRLTCSRRSLGAGKNANVRFAHGRGRGIKAA